MGQSKCDSHKYQGNRLVNLVLYGQNSYTIADIYGLDDDIMELLTLDPTRIFNSEAFASGKNLRGECQPPSLIP